MLNFIKENLIDKFNCDVKKFSEFVKESKTYNFYQLKGDASTRNYYRIKEKERKSFVLMENGPSQIISEEGGGQANKIFQLKELPYINLYNFLKPLKIDIPEIYYVDDKQRILILEDLGDELLEYYVKGKSKKEILNKYKKAIEYLLIIQEKGTNSKNKDNCVAFHREFDVKLFDWEFEHFIEYSLGQKEDLYVLKREFHRISEELYKEPQVLVHRDYHSRNMLVLGDRLSIIDYQDSLLGPPQYDLASLLRDAYVVLSEDIVEELLDFYLEKRKIKDRDKFVRIFDLMSIQRNLKAIGRFDYINKVKNNPKFLKYITNLVGYVKKNLNKYKELDLIVGVLEKHYLK